MRKEGREARSKGEMTMVRTVSSNHGIQTAQLPVCVCGIVAPGKF